MMTRHNSITDLVRRSETEVHEATRTILELSGFCFQTKYKKVRITEYKHSNLTREQNIYTHTLICDSKLLNQTEYELKKRSEQHSRQVTPIKTTPTQHLSGYINKPSFQTPKSTPFLFINLLFKDRESVCTMSEETRANNLSTHSSTADLEGLA